VSADKWAASLTDYAGAPGGWIGSELRDFASFFGLKPEDVLICGIVGIDLNTMRAIMSTPDPSDLVTDADAHHITHLREWREVAERSLREYADLAMTGDDFHQRMLNWLTTATVSTSAGPMKPMVALRRDDLVLEAIRELTHPD
jgi:hypothetical protein